MSSEPCPTPGEMRHYVSGKLTWDAHEAVEQHIDECASCQTTLGALDETADTFISFDDAAASPSPDPQLRKLVENAKAISSRSPRTSTADESGISPGTVLGNYVVGKEIGSGGMGRVFKAFHQRMKRDVALKVLAPWLLPSPAARERFQREVEAAGQLNHANIVAAYDADESNGQVYLAMEFVDGRNLSEVVKQDGQLPIHTACEYVLQAARGLEYAHHRGIIHRDIKPSNLIVDSQRVVKILDMGLARRAIFEPGETDGSLTTSGSMMGTADFMPPEQAINPREADHRADIYSLGCTLYFLLTGEPLYQGKTAMEVVMAHREQPVPSLRRAAPDAPKALENLVQQMLAKQPDARPDSMAEIITGLESVVESASIAASEFAPSVQRKRIGWIVGGGLAAALVVALLVVRPWDKAPASRSDPTRLNANNAAGRIDSPKKDASDTDNAPKLEMQTIEPGKFLMGAPDSDKEARADEQPQHEVTLTRRFSIGKFEVTEAQFHEVMGFVPARGLPPDPMQPPAQSKPANLPVAGVSWFEAVKFCNALSKRYGLKPFYVIDGKKVTVTGSDGFRLSTEAEWEFACRAGSQARWHFGDEAKMLDDYEWHAGNSGGKFHPVGTKKPNVWNLHDMHGNVPEWVWDRYDPNFYRDSPAFDPAGATSGSQRVIRGGSATDRLRQTSASARKPLGSSYGSPLTTPVGFRVARYVK